MDIVYSYLIIAITAPNFVAGQDREVIMSGALDLARSTGGSIDKDQVKSAVDQ